MYSRLSLSSLRMGKANLEITVSGSGSSSGSGDTTSEPDSNLIVSVTSLLISFVKRVIGDLYKTSDSASGVVAPAGSSAIQSASKAEDFKTELYDISSKYLFDSSMKTVDAFKRKLALVNADDLVKVFENAGMTVPENYIVVFDYSDSGKVGSLTFYISEDLTQYRIYSDDYYSSTAGRFYKVDKDGIVSNVIFRELIRFSSSAGLSLRSLSPRVPHPRMWHIFKKCPFRPLRI